MIVSDLESLCTRLLLGAVMECAINRRDVYRLELETITDAFLKWARRPGVTDAAREEMRSSSPATWAPWVWV